MSLIEDVRKGVIEGVGLTTKNTASDVSRVPSPAAAQPVAQPTARPVPVLDRGLENQIPPGTGSLDTSTSRPIPEIGSDLFNPEEMPAIGRPVSDGRPETTPQLMPGLVGTQVLPDQVYGEDIPRAQYDFELFRRQLAEQKNSAEKAAQNYRANIRISPSNEGITGPPGAVRYGTRVDLGYNIPTLIDRARISPLDAFGTLIGSGFEGFVGLLTDSARINTTYIVAANALLFGKDAWFGTRNPIKAAREYWQGTGSTYLADNVNESLATSPLAYTITGLLGNPRGFLSFDESGSNPFRDFLLNPDLDLKNRDLYDAETIKADGRSTLVSRALRPLGDVLQRGVTVETNVTGRLINAAADRIDEFYYNPNVAWRIAGAAALDVLLDPLNTIDYAKSLTSTVDKKVLDVVEDVVDTARLQQVNRVPLLTDGTVQQKVPLSTRNAAQRRASEQKPASFQTVPLLPEKSSASQLKPGSTGALLVPAGTPPSSLRPRLATTVRENQKQLPPVRLSTEIQQYTEPVTELAVWRLPESRVTLYQQFDGRIIPTIDDKVKSIIRFDNDAFKPIGQVLSPSLEDAIRPSTNAITTYNASKLSRVADTVITETPRSIITYDLDSGAVRVTKDDARLRYATASPDEYRPSYGPALPATPDTWIPLDRPRSLMYVEEATSTLEKENVVQSILDLTAEVKAKAAERLLDSKNPTPLVSDDGLELLDDTIDDVGFTNVVDYLRQYNVRNAVADIDLLDNAKQALEKLKTAQDEAALPNFSGEAELPNFSREVDNTDLLDYSIEQVPADYNSLVDDWIKTVDETYAQHAGVFPKTVDDATGVIDSMLTNFANYDVADVVRSINDYKAGRFDNIGKAPANQSQNIAQLADEIEQAVEDAATDLTNEVRQLDNITYAAERKQRSQRVRKRAQEKESLFNEIKEEANLDPQPSVAECFVPVARAVPKPLSPDRIETSASSGAKKQTWNEVRSLAKQLDIKLPRTAKRADYEKAIKERQAEQSLTPVLEPEQISVAPVENTFSSDAYKKAVSQESKADLIASGRASIPSNADKEIWHRFFDELRAPKSTPTSRERVKTLLRDIYKSRESGKPVPDASLLEDLYGVRYYPADFAKGESSKELDAIIKQEAPETPKTPKLSVSIGGENIGEFEIKDAKKGTINKELREYSAEFPGSSVQVTINGDTYSSYTSPFSLMTKAQLKELAAANDITISPDRLVLEDKLDQLWKNDQLDGIDIPGPDEAVDADMWRNTYGFGGSRRGT